MIASSDLRSRPAAKPPEAPEAPGEPMHEQSIEVVLEALYPWARRVAVLLCRDRDHAEDMVQDAFVQALRRPPRPVNTDVVRAWLRVVLLRLHLRRRRSALREARALMRLHRPPVVQPLEESTTEVLGALASLSPKQRACIVLRYFEDLSEPEVARLLKLRPGTVKAHLAQGRQRLRERLADG